MRKLKLQVQMSVDGFIAGPNGEMDWMTFNWSDDLVIFVRDLTASFDTIILGRKLAEGFIPHWQNVVSDPNNPEYEGGLVYTKTPKIVFSKTLEASEWENTALAKGDLVEEIRRLKSQRGGDIIAYGGAGFVSNLIKNNLIDDYFLFVNPVILGSGMPIFQGLETALPLNLVSARVFDCGIVVQHFQPK